MIEDYDAGGGREEEHPERKRLLEEGRGLGSSSEAEVRAYQKLRRAQPAAAGTVPKEERMLQDAKAEAKYIPPEVPEYRNQFKCTAKSKGAFAAYYCGTRWGITNMVHIVERWEINELKFFWDGHCTQEVEGTSQQQSFSDDSLGNVNTANLAFDNSNKTMYLSNCGYNLGGCLPFDPTATGQDKKNGKKNTVIYKQLVQTEPEFDPYL